MNKDKLGRVIPYLALVSIISVILLAANSGIRKYLNERQKPGYITHPIILSGPCPSSIRCTEDGQNMRLVDCFQHKHLHRQACRFEHEGYKKHYLYVVCG